MCLCNEKSAALIGQLPRPGSIEELKTPDFWGKLVCAIVCIVVNDGGKTCGLDLPLPPCIKQKCQPNH